ncbi:SGNH/GDSL hydrolase family protein [Nocardioides sp. Kera G14]|uniref:SGNH/GDSL hydrolase family protein n=1 Tax=Nocardioides sp. Kera G14 TaxID=2884264 RepID=UPI001D0FC38E|nr:SGNH/GDSL hydrolase family protein [Nocardioides sp. Kera G14]UDY23371.1 SGNH/GDSL hydrolase family protein [Nocardioides sp. Kera G14]
MRSSRGASTAEYVGSTIIAAGIALAVTLTPVRHELADGIHQAVCSVLQQTACRTPGSGETPLEQATSGRYVALGDSYSSGEGAWDYEEGTDFDDRDDAWPFDDDNELHNRCHRSPHAYSQVLAATNDFEGGTTFVACSGSILADLEQPNHKETGEDPQSDALGDDVSLITMTMGGNDLGFADVLRDCILNGARGVGPDTCQAKHDARIKALLPVLEQQLIATYRALQKKAPNARIVIVGYPQLFVDNPTDDFHDLLYKEDQVWMNQKAADLNAMLRDAAKQAGVTFVDPTAAFHGHGIGSADPWINDLDFGGPGMMIVDPSSFHPNAMGHQAIADLVQQAIEHPR